MTWMPPWMKLRAKGAEIAIGPLTRNPGLRLAFIRGPEGIMIECRGKSEPRVRLYSPYPSPTGAAGVRDQRCLHDPAGFC
jgi:hypothetical protein